MNLTNAPLQAVPVLASTPPSRRLPMAIGSQSKRAVPPPPVQGVDTELASPYEATAPELVTSVEAAPAPYSHWGINE